jgi:hypothetical protein
LFSCIEYISLYDNCITIATLIYFINSNSNTTMDHELRWWFLKFEKDTVFQSFNYKRTYYKLSTFLSVDIEILTPWSSQVHHEAQPNSKLLYFLLILSKNKENVTFTWATGVQNVLCLNITRDKFVIYVPRGVLG